MTKVITYGTYDLLHEGHVKLLKRAKALGDYLIVGVTGDGFDLNRGKINVQQSLMERIEAVKATGLADQIIVEEYEGQKIDDIRRYDADIFTVGSDWKGKFDYLNDYCKVVYLDRTEGISSSEIRAGKREIRIGIIGNSPLINKYVRESGFVNGVTISGLCTEDPFHLNEELRNLPCVTKSMEVLFRISDAVYIITPPKDHFEDIRRSIKAGKHVICEAPVTLSVDQYDILLRMAKERGLVLMDAIKTAYSTAFNRMMLLIKGGVIGDVVSVDATCTSLREVTPELIRSHSYIWNTMSFWAPTGLLPVFGILGSDYASSTIASRLMEESPPFDLFSRISFIFPQAVASVKIGQGVKSEGELIVSGTKGYVYVPAPWWKTDYFEIRYENPAENRRFFYQLDGEGIRYEILSFLKQIENGTRYSYIGEEVTRSTISVIEAFHKGRYLTLR